MGNSVGKGYLIMKHAQLATSLRAPHLSSHPVTAYSFIPARPRKVIYVLQFTHTQLYE